MPTPNKKAAVLGYPVHHSRSPRLHGYWLKYYNIAGSYEAIEVAPENLATTLKSLPEKGFTGCNLTLPHKEAALAIMDEIDATARMIGAVNTVVVRGGKLCGSNSDVYGFIQNLKQHARLSDYAHKAVILGAGGAARAVLYALLQEGFGDITITNRTQARAQDLAAHFADNRIRVVGWERRDASLEVAGLLVNTTSLGLSGQPPLELSLAALPTKALVTDIIYSPLITPLLQRASERGNKVVDGLGMLLHQAVPGFEAWFGLRPEVTPELRAVVLREGA